MDNNKIDNLYKKSFILISLLLGFFMIRQMRSVILPIITAIFIYLIFFPHIEKLYKKELKRYLIVLIFTFILLLVILSIIFVLFYIMEGLLKALPKYSDSAYDLFYNTLKKINETYSLNLSTSKETLGSFINYPMIFIKENFGIFRKLLSSLFLVFIYDFFLMLEHREITQYIGKYLNKDKTKIISLTIKQMSDYMGMKLLISFATSLLFYFMLLYYKVNNIYLLSMLVFIFNLIPTIGSIIVTIVVCLLALLQFSQNIKIVIAIAILSIVIQFVMGNIIDTKIIGKKVKLSSVIILVSLSIWGYVFGIVGMVMAVPITCMINNFLKYYKKI